MGIGLWGLACMRVRLSLDSAVSQNMALKHGLFTNYMLSSARATATKSSETQSTALVPPPRTPPRTPPHALTLTSTTLAVTTLTSTWPECSPKAR